MGKLVRQDFFQLLGVIERPLHRDANLAVKDTARPRRASRNITELFLSIEDDGDNTGWVCQKGGADPPIGFLQGLDRRAREALLRRAFKEHGEVRAQLLLESTVQ